MLTLIDTKKDLIDNLAKVESYLNFEEGEEMRTEMIKLILRGQNFVVYTVDNEIHFAPSRFAGYLNHTIPKHLIDGNGKHGSYTSKKIRTILGTDVYEKATGKQYIDYCKSLNINCTTSIHPNRPQTFWWIDYSIPSKSSFPEGKTKEEKHKRRERSSQLIQVAKAKYISENECECQICNFNFENTYGVVGKNFIEAHHTIPVSELKDGDETRIEDIAFICANCHRMLHRRRPWLSMNKLRQLLK